MNSKSSVKNESKKLTIITIAMVIILVIIFAGVTYAFFTANNPEGSTAQIISETGRMLITYNDGTDNIVPVTNIQPSNTILVNKTFTLTGSNTTVGMSEGDGLPMPYKVGVQYTSTFSDGMMHYYIKEVNRPANSNVTVNYVITPETGNKNQTVPGNDTYTGYTHGIFKNDKKYMEMVTGEFPASLNDQTITFNLILQFPDNNENQDSEKGKTFNGKVVVNYKESASATDTLIAKFDSETKTNGVSTSGLFIDNTSDANLRYTGANPNNYVEFGNDNELWRIVGVFNVKDSTGKIERKIKLVRNESLGDFSWDATGNGNYGFNNWTEADLKNELNGDYLDTTLTSNKNNWYNSYWDNKPVLRQTGVFNYTKIIKSKYQNMISNSVWNIGRNSYTGSAPYTLNLLSQYNKERGTITSQNSRPTEWTGKVGLIYSSDYGYASTNSECRENLRAGVTYDTANYKWDYTNGKCKTDNWLFKNSPYWTLSSDSDSTFSVFGVLEHGAVSIYSAYNSLSVFPAVFLKSDILIASGNGEKESPYRLG